MGKLGTESRHIRNDKDRTIVSETWVYLDNVMGMSTGEINPLTVKIEGHRIIQRNVTIKYVYILPPNTTFIIM